MPNLKINLRRSPRKLLERDGHPGPGPGHLALIMARAGVGKTAFLVDIGIDAMLSEQKVLHVSLNKTVDKIRTWYDDILMEMLRSEKQLEHWASIQLDVERQRHIHSYIGHSFSVAKLRKAIDLLKDVMHFEPQVLIFDEIEADDLGADTVAEVKALAQEINAELWMSCQISRDDFEGEPGHLPPPANKLEDLVDVAFRLDPQDSKVRLHVMKDHNEMLNEDLHIVLDPQTQLLTVGFGT